MGNSLSSFSFFSFSLRSLFIFFRKLKLVLASSIANVFFIDSLFKVVFRSTSNFPRAPLRFYRQLFRMMDSREVFKFLLLIFDNNFFINKLIHCQIITHIHLSNQQTDMVGLQLIQFEQTVSLMSLQIISFDGRYFKLTAQGEAFLRSLEGIKQIGILSIIGKSRSGKSFFLNQVLLESEQFQISHTTNSCTKGIWVSEKLIDSPYNPGVKIMVMDVEGLGGTEDKSINDHRILLLPLLISSYLIYNSTGYITEDAIRGLGVVLGLTQQLQGQSSEISLPFFHWIIRDFTLELTDNLGYPITQKQYLERSLEDQKGGESVEVKNKIRRKFRDFFKNRDCSTLIRPYKQSMEDLRPQFQAESKRIRSKILSEIKPKQIKGIKLTPSILLQLIQNILANINNGISPCIDSTWRLIYLEHQKNLLNRLQYKMFDEIQELSQEQYPVAYMRIKNRFQQQFELESFGVQIGSDALSQIAGEKRRILQQMKAHIDENIKKMEIKKADEEMKRFIEEIRETNFIRERNIKSMEGVRKEVEELIRKRGFMLSDTNRNRVKEIREKVETVMMERLCARLQSENKEMVEEVEFLKGNCEEGLTLHRKQERELKEIRERFCSLELELEHSRKEKDITIRNLQEEVFKKRVKQQQQNQTIISMKRRLEIADNSQQYDLTIRRIQQLQASLLSVQKQYTYLTEEQGELKGHNFILREEKNELERQMGELKNEAARKDEELEEIEKRIMLQVEKEERRVEELLAEGHSREEEKDKRIERLERIIKEVKSKPQRLEEELARSKRLQEELAVEREKTKRLENQAEELKQIYQYKLNSILHKKDPIQNRSAVMNLELTSSNIKMKSFKSPPKLKDWEKERICLEAQISLQEQIIKESKTVISSLLKKEQKYVDEIKELREQLGEGQDWSELSSIKSAKDNKECWRNIKNISSWDSFSVVSVRVPSFTIKSAGEGHSITQYLLQFTCGESVWTSKVRYKQILSLVTNLSNRYPQVPVLKPSKAIKVQDKKKDIQRMLQHCLVIQQYRNDPEFKSFIFSSKEEFNSTMKHSQKMMSYGSEERMFSPKPKQVLKNKENIKTKTGNKNPHFSIYIDA